MISNRFLTHRPGSYSHNHKYLCIRIMELTQSFLRGQSELRSSTLFYLITFLEQGYGGIIILKVEEFFLDKEVGVGTA